MKLVLALKKQYMELGHKSFRKLVWMKPGSRQPNVRAGGPVEQEKNFVTTNGEEPGFWYGKGIIKEETTLSIRENG